MFGYFIISISYDYSWSGGDIESVFFIIFCIDNINGFYVFYFEGDVKF